jgi:hypothetical protein
MYGDRVITFPFGDGSTVSVHQKVNFPAICMMRGSRVLVELRIWGLIYLSPDENTALLVRMPTLIDRGFIPSSYCVSTIS